MPFDEDNSYKDRLSGVVGFDPISDSEELARPGPKSAAQTPAPPKERIKGSKENPEGTAATRSKAGDIEISEANEQALKDKIAEFKKSHPKKNAPSLGTLKKVFRRGAGAFSTSFRPTISGGQPNSRNAWAMARVNKFLKMAGGGEVKESYRKADGDLLEERFEDCGTGAGGFKPGNTCASGGGGGAEITTPQKKYADTGIAAYDKGLLGVKKGADVSKYGFERTTVSTKEKDLREAFFTKDKSVKIIFDHQPIYYDERDDVVRYIPSHQASESEKHKNAVTVEAIYVDPKSRGKGLGQKALDGLKKASDELGVDLRVYPTEINPKSKFAEMLKATSKDLKGGPSTDQLVQWYKKNGFENYSPNSDKVLVYKSKLTK